MPSRASRVKVFDLSDRNTSSSAKMPLVVGWSRGQRARAAGEGPGGEPASSAGWIDGEMDRWRGQREPPAPPAQMGSSSAPGGSSTGANLSAYKVPTACRTVPDPGLEAHTL